MTKYNENNIRLAAYYNWQNAGCPSGQDEYFWNMAINQLYGSQNCSCKCSKTKTTKTTSKSSTKASATSTAKKVAAKKK
ncbi:MAG: DUF2934 domain-containing protein [Alphaproteobacteria bacterium]|nr:DUF2934 domain-containing protein [Alphaproteobacteria bacterium]